MTEFTTRWRALAVSLALAAGLAALAPTAADAAAPSAAAASATSCDGTLAGQPPSPGTDDNRLNAVTVLSACNAWAVGLVRNGPVTQTLTEHWNGKAWKVVPSPSPSATFSELTGVRAASASDIWAVGDIQTSATASQTLILHWNGAAWKQVPSPSPGTSFNELLAVRAISAGDAWAVGSFADNEVVRQTLTLHWNGKAWRQVPSPNVGSAPSRETLSGVAATSGHDVWAVGTILTSPLAHRTLILHWNGRKWSHVASPNPERSNSLQAAAVVSPTNAWAVGVAGSGSTFHTLVLHWNGHRWSRVTSPSPGGTGFVDSLSGVTATSAGNAVAVGAAGTGTAIGSLILHWNGRAWKQVPSPSPGGPQSGSLLFGVAATAAAGAWAVGRFTGSTVFQAFATHCC